MVLLKERLTELLINNNLITRQQLDRALDVQRQKGGKLSLIIIELGFIRESDLISVLSQGLGFPLIDLKRFKIEPETAMLISPQVAKLYQIIPLSKIADTITLAMADPLNIFAIDYVRSLTGYKINPIIAASRDISQAIEASYPDSSKDMIENIVKEMADFSIELIKEEREILPNAKELDRVSKEAPVIKVVNMILDEAVKNKASDVLIEPLDDKLRVRFRIDGILHEQLSPPKTMHAPIVSRIKVISELNIAEHRLPQDGRFKANISDREVDFRVSILPSSLGEKVAVRILDKTVNILDIERLGFSRNIIDRLKVFSALPHGMILICGPTGSGKTTTLYSILEFIDNPQKNIVTVEDPVEFQLTGINQVTVRPDIGLTFAGALRSILRQDPNIIMIGEIRDYETVDIAIKSALTGHLVLSTLHTTTASGAVVRLINMGVEPYLINASVICAVAQRLIRKICPFCREKYKMKKELMDSMRLSAADFDLSKLDDGFVRSIAENKEFEFSRGKGCPRCFNLGYSGRLGIAEVLALTPAIRELILSRAQEHIIKQSARKEGMRTLREEGLIAALQGLTTVEEVLRVTAPDE